jgi:iron complex outermembrane recepter protein
MRNVNGAMLLRFHKCSLAVAALLGVGFAPNVLAQSTGTDAIEESMDEVVVSATRIRNIGLVGQQTAPKSRVSLTSEYLETQAAGQSVFQSINQIPGVNFTNNDAFGTSGGNLRIRGFDGSRVSVTFDGVPLNDSGNYALFTNQMLDPELIDRVDVNLGTTDVDSPTASATGGTVAYRTRKPTEDFGGQAVVSGGDENYQRAFLRVDSGEFGPWATKAFVSASYQKYDKFKGPGELEKKQFNAAVRQDFENDNFISLAFHYNINRNAFYRTSSAANFAAFGRDYDNLATCTRDTPTPNVADNEGFLPPSNTQPPLPAPLFADMLIYPGSCTNYYGLRINPSDTGNIRMQSLWHLGDKVRLTFDPSWQYTLANGGGSATVAESFGNSADVRAVGASNLTGFDLNGDGDVLDSPRFYTPNTTNTKRFGATTSLIWDINDDNRVRVAYTWDRARHRQTGMWGPLTDAGNPEDVFAGRKGERVLGADGSIIRGRDRFSVAELGQYSLEWRGQFAGDKLAATVGVRSTTLSRELNQYCYTPDGGTGSSGTINAGGGVLCTTRSPNAVLANGNVTFVTPMTGSAVQFVRPYSDDVEFDDVLPNVGLSFQPWDNHMFYLSYAEGLSAPRTDNLYSVRRLGDGSIGRPTPESESTKAIDLGWRLNAANTLASVAVWRIDYTNRIVSSFDPEVGYSVDRNVGDVDMWGAEAQIAQRFGEAFSLSASGSYIKTELLENQPFGLNPMGVLQFVPLKGNELVETPNLQFSLRADYEITEALHVGLQGKWVDERFSTDLNDEVTPAYTVVDFDASYSFNMGEKQSLQLQLNVSNVLDEEYFGTISSGLGTNPECVTVDGAALGRCVNPAGTPQSGGVGFFSIGSPRTVLASVKYSF